MCQTQETRNTEMFTICDEATCIQRRKRSHRKQQAFLQGGLTPCLNSAAHRPPSARGDITDRLRQHAKPR